MRRAAAAAAAAAAATGRRRAASAAADTIVALATGGRAAALAVVRVSGPGADAVLAGLLPARARLPEHRRASLVRLVGGQGGDGARPPLLLDVALALRFPPASSYTGEPAAELHVHGGPAVVGAVLAAALAVPLGGPGAPHARLAAPGEFTRRALDAGKLDLTTAEGVAELTAARTEAARAAAAALADGQLSDAAARWRAEIVRLLALAEAAIDFEDDDPGIRVEGGDGGSLSPASPAAAVAAPALTLAAELAAHLDAGARAELAREGVRVALAGRPNAGKSSLYNALANRAAAIVTPEPGTTRDVAEIGVDVSGTPLVVCDAAGVREAVGAAEAEGVRRAVALAEGAPVLCCVVDAAALEVDDAGAFVGGLLADLVGGGDGGAAAADADPRPRAVVLVLNKWDAVPADKQAPLLAAASSALPSALAVLPASAATGAGVPRLAAALAAAAAAFAPVDPGAAPPLVARHRHRQAVAGAAAGLRDAAAAAAADAPDLAAEGLTTALRAVDALTGARDAGKDSEAVLDAVFATFCVGK